jgi:hypothetical protein
MVQSNQSMSIKAKRRPKISNGSSEKVIILYKFNTPFYSIELENIYVCGMTLIKEFHVVCQFTLPKVQVVPEGDQ